VGFAATGGGESPAAVRYFVQSLASLPQQLGLPTRLSQVGVTGDRVRVTVTVTVRVRFRVRVRVRASCRRG